MRPTHPVELLACAIAQQEGFHVAGATPAVRNNPGDLRFASQIGAQTPPPSNFPPPIATFDSLPHGIAALYRQLWLQVARGQTVAAIIAQWAPPNENDTGSYLQNVLKWTGLPADVPVLQLLPPLERL